MNPLVIKFGGYQKPASINNAAARRFGEVLQARLGDQISFQLIGNVLDLGRPSGDLPVMVKNGELSLCYISSVRFTEPVPEFKVLELPFVVKNRASIQRAFAGEFGEICKSRMRDATAFRLLGLWDNGFRHLTNRVRPIRTPADCRGLRIRTQMSELHGEALGALGFVPIPVDVKEFVEQIAGDRFDAQENPLTNTYNFGVHHYHRYITLTGHFFGASVMICNAQHYAGWPPDVQDAVAEAAAQATALQLELAAAEDEQILAKFDPRHNEVVHLTDAERAAFVAAVQPVLLKYRREFDPQLFAWIEPRS
ncbi:MAG: TRAP transporter substrate-binding protein [Pseudomonadota bacterium]